MESVNMEYAQQENAASASAGQQRVRRLKLILSIVVGISLLCITIGIATPGWIVHSLETYSVHAGLFYIVTCTKSPEMKCESLSIIKNVFDSMKGASDLRKIALRREFCLGYLRQEIGAVLAWLLCLSVLVILLVHRQSKQKDLIDYWLALASALSVAGVIMGETIYVYLVETEAANSNGGVKLGFPYAMVFYMIGCILVFISVVLMFRIFKREVNALRPGYHSSDLAVINATHQT